MLTLEQQKLVEDNHNLIYWFVNKKNLDIEEYYDLFAISLCETALRFNPTKGKFSTLAIYMFNNVYVQQIRESNQLKKVPKQNMVTLESYDVLHMSKDVDSDLEVQMFLNKFEDDELLNYLVKGYNITEIAKIKGCSKQTMHKRRNERRKKWKKELTYQS